MGVTLPTFADLGLRDPQAAGAAPVYPAEDPGAQGLAVLGKGVQAAGGALEDVAADAQRKKDKLEEAMSTVDLFNRLTPLHAQAAKETDPAKLAEIRNQYNDLLQTSGAAISNPLRRQMWTATHSKTIAQAQADADTRNTGLGREQATADIWRQRDDAVRNAVASDDPMAIPNAQMAIDGLGKYASDYGALDPKQKYIFDKQSQNQLYEGRADRLIQQGKADEAKTFLEANRDKIDPVALERLQIRADAKGRKNNTDGIALEALGLPSIGVGSLPSVPAGAPTMRVGGAIAQGVAAEAKSQGVNPSLALTTAQIESSMGRNLGSRGNIFQLGKPEWASVGGGAMGQPETDIKNGVAFLARTQQQLEEALGRSPSAAEIYLAHQQGVGGATKLLANPDTPAGQLVPPQNISANGGDPNAPASAFVGKVNGIYQRVSANIGAAPVDDLSKYRAEYDALKPVPATRSATTPKYEAPPSGKESFEDWMLRLHPDVPLTGGADKGLLDPGNINLNNRPVVKNADGSISTVRSMSFNDNGKEVLIPTVAADGSGILSDEDAIAQYRKTGQFLGKFDTPENATAYAQNLHQAQAQQYGRPDQLVGQSAPTAAAQPTQSRTGLPSLTDAYTNILRNPRVKTDQDVRDAFATATAVHNAMEADASRAERIQQQRQHQAMKQREDQVWADVYSPQPKMTASQLAVDPAFSGNPERRKAMIELINNPPGSGIPAPQSYAAAQAVIDRIRLPEGNENKITDRNQIYDQMRSMNKDDLNFALTKFDELSSPGEHKFGQRLETFFREITPQIDRSGALPGLPSDSRGKAKSYEYRRFVEDQVDQARKAGKNPDDLINPKNSAYLGAAETLKPYKRTIKEALEDFSTDMNVGGLNAEKPAVSAVEITATGPGGSQIALRNGQWVDIKTGNPLPPANVSVPIR